MLVGICEEVALERIASNSSSGVRNFGRVGVLRPALAIRANLGRGEFLRVGTVLTQMLTYQLIDHDRWLGFGTNAVDLEIFNKLLVERNAELNLFISDLQHIQITCQRFYHRICRSDFSVVPDASLARILDIFNAQNYL